MGSTSREYTERMCQLLGMNSRLPASLTLSFTGFSQRGGCTDHHSDGWGIAFFEADGQTPGRAARHFVDKESAATSPIAQMLRDTCAGSVMPQSTAATMSQCSSAVAKRARLSGL